MLGSPYHFWQDTHPTGPGGHQFKEFNKKKCMKVLLQRCEEDKEAHREQQRDWHQWEVFNIVDLNGTRWSKEAVENGGRCRCGGKAIKSNMAIEEYGNYQHHSCSDKPQPLSPGAFYSHVRARRQGGLDDEVL